MRAFPIWVLSFFFALNLKANYLYFICTPHSFPFLLSLSIALVVSLAPFLNQKQDFVHLFSLSLSLVFVVVFLSLFGFHFTSEKKKTTTKIRDSVENIL